MFFCRRKALPFWKKTRSIWKKNLFRNQKAFSKMGLGVEMKGKSVATNYTLSLSPYDNHLKNRFVYSHHLTDVNIIMGLDIVALPY